MILIKLTNPTQSISVTVDIKGIDLWHYRYLISTNNRFTNSPVDGKDDTNDLGRAENLNLKTHYWGIQLANKYDNDRKVTIKIIWKENGQEIATWIPDESDKDGKVLLKANSALEITDSAFFVNL